MKKIWRKPVIIEQDVALEVTAYQSAQLEKAPR